MKKTIIRKNSTLSHMILSLFKKKMYSKYYLIPINYNYLLKKKYGKNWKFPDKKEQLYYV